MNGWSLTYAPNNADDQKVRAYGHVFTVGVPRDLGDDEAAYTKLKNNPEFSTGEKRSASLGTAPIQPASNPDPSADESNDGKDAPTRAAVQKRAVLSLKSAPPPEDV
jgi:hypothetical protein